MTCSNTSQGKPALEVENVGKIEKKTIIQRCYSVLSSLFHFFFSDVLILKGTSEIREGKSILYVIAR